MTTRTFQSFLIGGSIESILDDMIGGFNAFLDEQRKQPGTPTLTLVQFDSQDSYEIIYDFKLHCDSREWGLHVRMSTTTH